MGADVMPEQSGARTFYYVMPDGRRIPGVTKVMTAEEAEAANARQAKLLLYGRWKADAELSASGQRSRVYKFTRRET